MTEQNPNDTGVWGPPVSEPSWFMPARRIPRADTRVWPPPDPAGDPRGTSTVPIPVVGDRPPSRPWPGPPTPPAGPPAPPPGPPVPGPGEPPFSAAEADAGHGGRPRRRRRALPGPVKVGLQLAGALALAAALLGVRGWDAYDRYRQTDPAPVVQRVAAGQAATLEHARWRLLGIGPGPEQMTSSDPPDRVTLQISVEATVLDDKGRFLNISPPAFYLGDRSGRTWKALPWKSPPDQIEPGSAGRFTLISSVPRPLAGQVELEVWPNERVAKEESGPYLRFRR
ncbi:hypothetical protein Sru01_46610 [Sphaerisporangium rufum]|uniref:DUF4352 domain-containing protein n=1 Tax=Sphaerisporangium rufum TaxID=1381558 RepID=A0A919V1F3_9ACTN|nr:hypothetical protein [Sphaerisporangium rufum]GII79679.1 hypothetical protein Sru01_46610 [Sphaerisporangium rufum]